MEKTLRQKLLDYTVPPKAVDTINQTKIVFLVGVSGAGKDTILQKLLNTGKYRYVVSHTTRRPRYNKGVLEQEGVDYHFIDARTASRMLDREEFIEAKMYGDSIYGTSVAEVKKAYDSNRIAITDIEVQGVTEYKAIAPNIIPIFLLPPDFETWQRRLLKRYERNEPDPENIKRRMQTAKVELQEALNRDYFEFVINDDLDRTVNAVKEIVEGNLSAEKNQQARKLAEDLLKKLSA